MTNTDQPSSDADSESESVAPNEPIVYDEDGDLTILVGPEPDVPQYRVDSKTLSRSSPVFKKMLFGGFAESRPSNGKDWVVHLPDDDFSSMEIIFSIAHGVFEDVPTSISVHDLYTLLAHTEKYDSTHLLRPWAKLWSDYLVLTRDRTEPKLLCVAWGLGDEDLFREMVRAIANNCLIDADGNVFYGPSGLSGFALSSLIHLMPPDIEETIEENRTRLVAAELEPFINIYNACITTGTSRCASKGDGWKCDSMVLGSLIKALLGVGIDITMPNVVDLYRGSVSDLRQMLREMHIVSFCKALILTDSQIEYLDRQAERTGL
ncbi:hypothetical protein LZ31DRAFT_566043 [Colletotrichum somersetense]|nr:hypothetical protein LZ31DRAFT_566043 [Colletotrichum somersetense]